MISISIKR